MAVLIRGLVAVLVAFLLLARSEPAEAAKIQYMFEDWGGPPLQVFASKPVGLAADRPVVFVMHGVRRNALDYRDQWHELALEHDFLLVVPEFGAADFDGSDGYNFGNVFDRNGTAQPGDRWSYSAIEPLFDDIKRRYGMTSDTYVIYGHSAGAQFVHRFIYHVPDARIGQAIVANAGWYMMPDLDTTYPYGFRDSLVGRRQLELALQLPVTVLLGDEDIDPDHPNLRRTDEALQQGEHRFARGQRYFESARAAATTLGVPFNWQQVIVPGADHDNTLMAPAASELISPLGELEQADRVEEELEQASRREPQSLRVMSFNAWGAGLNEGKSIDETVAVIRAANPDIVGLQEVRAESQDCVAADCNTRGQSVAAGLAAALGFHYFESSKTNGANWSNAILSRYPIGAATPNELGVAIDVNGTTVYAFNVHLPAAPYQPYQLLGIEYGDGPFLQTERQAIKAADMARREGLKLLFADVRGIPWDAHAVITGDFNEPSHRDWTPRAAQAGLHPMAVRFPSVHNVEKRGFVDAIRHLHPDEVDVPAFTWTPTTLPDDPKDHHDRIDFVLVKKRGVNMSIEQALIVGEKSPEADIVVTPWPSDHRAVLVEVLLKDKRRGN